MDIYKELASIINAFEREKLDYALCGGLALALHGFTRFTKDIDILIQKSDLDNAVAIVKDIGFILEAGIIPFKVGTPQRHEVYRISKAEGSNLLTLDLILVYDVLKEVWDDRDEFKWEHGRIKAVSYEGLVFMKRMAGRKQDLTDIERLKEAREHEKE